MSQHKYIIVSNRLPISVSKEDGKLVFTSSSGGLATSMSSVVEEDIDTFWIGWPGISSDELTVSDKALITRRLKKLGCRPVFLNDEEIKAFYGGYCNNTIWPLFHYFQSVAEYNDAYWAAYQKVNRLFQKAVLTETKAGSTIWIHDYHLMLLPALIRRSRPKASIGFFLHIPFPSYEIFRLLPKRREVLHGLLGADMLGFHIYDYARHFLNSVSRILGYEDHGGLVEVDDRIIKVETFPLGIDYEKFADAVHEPEVRRQIRMIKKSYPGQKIILSVDRLDYTKGIVQRLNAYELLLRENPSLHKKVMLLAVIIPSRTDVRVYQRLKNEIEQTIGRINGRYGTSNWTPIVYQSKNLPFEQIVAHYAAADVALVTPLRDGMNLVSKEYVAVKQHGDGVLILSEMAGAMDELQESVHVNPNDIVYIKDAMLRALTMSPREKKKRLKVMQQRLIANSVHTWATDFLEQLDEVKRLQNEQSDKLLDAKSLKSLLGAFNRSAKRLIILDYDGTIQKFFKSPDPRLARPSPSLLRLIKKLATQRGTKLCIVSGRSRQALDLWFRDLPISLVAEHGAWVKEGGKWLHTKNTFTGHKPQLLRILRHYDRRTVGSHIEEKDYSLVWHYRNVPPELAYVRNVRLKRELDRLLDGTGIAAHYGNKIIEVKPKVVNKGVAVRKLLADNPADFIMCIGDDYTDEDMFQALPGDAYTMRVGLGRTNAHFRLPAISSVLNLLKNLTGTAKTVLIVSALGLILG